MNKVIPKTFMVMLLMFFSGIILATENQDDIESVSIPKMVFSFPEFSTSTKKLEPVKIEGVGYAIGEVYKEEGKLFLGHSVGFILPKENEGGVLKITFVSVPKDPVELSFKLFPHDSEPEILELEIETIEVQTPARQVYIFLGIEGADRLEVEEIEFVQSTELSDPNNCDCQQVKHLILEHLDFSIVDYSLIME